MTTETNDFNPSPILAARAEADRGIDAVLADIERLLEADSP
jgi:DNA-binding PucR family transcriptional regulator